MPKLPTISRATQLRSSPSNHRSARDVSRPSLAHLVAPLVVGLALLGCLEPFGKDALDLPDVGARQVLGVPRILEFNPSSGSHEVVEASVDFGQVPVGQQVRREIVIRNAGRAPFTVADAQATGTGVSHFIYQAPGFEVQPNEQVTYGLTFKPATGGERTATLSLNIEDGDVPSLIIHVLGTATTPACEPSTHDLGFGDAAIGTTRFMEITFTNDADSPTVVFVAPIVSDQFAFGSGFAAGNNYIPAHSKDGPGVLTIPVTFTPTSTAEAFAQFEITKPAECFAQIVLRGNGVDRHLLCEPIEMSGWTQVCRIFFGYANPGTTVIKAAHFRNMTDHAITVTIGRIRTSSYQGDFAIDTSRSLVVVPAGGTEDSVPISFAPDELGWMNAFLDYTTTDPSQPTGTVELVGVGGGPAAQVEPAALDVGRAAVGAQASKCLELMNVGMGARSDPNDNLLLAEEVDGVWVEKRPEIRGPNATEFALDWPPAGYSSVGIDEYKPAILTVRLQPTTPGTKSATLIIFANDLAAPIVQVPLSDTALVLPECNFEIRPPSVDFGTVEPYSSAELRFSFVNRDPDPTHACIVSSAAITTNFGPGFSFGAGAVEDVLVDGGGALTIPVVFRPYETGPFSGEVVLSISSSIQPEAHIPLTGNADATCLMIAPRRHDFGTSGLSCNSAQAFAVYNLCGAPTPVNTIDLQPGSSSDYTITQRPALPATIPVNGSLQFGVTYRASNVGDDFGAIALRTSGSATFIVALDGSATTNATETEVFGPPPYPKLDLLFVIDSSATMAGKPTASNLHDSIDQFVRQRIDYHIGVTTTDLLVEAGRLVPLTGNNPRIITPSTPNKVQVFDSNIAFGPGHGETEALLRPVYLALSNPLTHGHNAGFYRDEALLSVVMISDAADTDPNSEPVTCYEDFLLNLKGRKRRNDVMVSGVLATQAQPPAGCSYDSVSAGQDTRVKDLVQRTGGTTTEICNSDWSSVLRHLTERTIYFLAKQPDLTVTNPVAVTVDGLPYTQYDVDGAQRWSYDASNNAVVFTTTAAPSRSSTLAISYHPICL